MTKKQANDVCERAKINQINVHCAFDEIVETSTLIENPKNPNTHPEEQIKLLADIIKRTGWRAPITVSKRSGYIVKGHGRLKAAKLAGFESVPVEYQNFESDDIVRSQQYLYENKPVIQLTYTLERKEIELKDAKYTDNNENDDHYKVTGKKVVIKFFDPNFKKFKDYYIFCILYNLGMCDSNNNRWIEDVLREYKENKTNNKSAEKNIKESVEDEYMTESFFSKAEKYKERIENIEKTKPETYDNIKDIDNYLTKHMDDIKKVSDILDKEADEVTSNNAATLISMITGPIIYCFTIVISLAVSEAAATASIVVFCIGLGAFFISLILSSILSILNYMKANKDYSYLKDLTKVKNRLIKIQKNNKLPEKIDKKITTAIDVINDAESKWNNANDVNIKENSILETYVDNYMENSNTIKELEADKYNHHVNQIKALSESNNDILYNIFYLLNEAANIEEEIKPIINELNRKGYKTKYSSPGHSKLRKKEDRFRDGNYYGKLYSDARIMFDGKYNFPSAPKYWMWKNVDGNDYLDIVPIEYDEEDGTPDEAFNTWKKYYMDSLKNYVSSLKDVDSAKGDDNGPKDTYKSDNIEKKEDIKESTTEMLEDMISLF